MVTIELGGVRLECQTKPDLFSPKGLDQGTALLLQQLPKLNYRTALDWGCGWGAIGLWLAANRPKSQVYAVDANVGAVNLTSQNAEHNQLNNLTVIASDSFEQLPPDVRFDLIASNPPTHQGRAIVEQMITDSFARLNAGGHLVIVVEARLKPWVARSLNQVFGSHKILDRGPKNVVLSAQKPL